jgi:LPS export ABC transporter protein LptC
MRRSEATRYARWSAMIAAGAFLVVAGWYVRRSVQQARTVRSAPPAVPTSVQQQSMKFALSKASGEHTLFQVEASHATAFTQGNRNVLQDVAITIFGQRGDRRDRIHTGECDYFSDSGKVLCKGNVHVELEAESDARSRPGRQVVRADTSQVTFERETGASHSDQPVKFSFPYGEGRAVGFTYDSSHSVVRLEHDVSMTLHRLTAGGVAVGSASATEITAAGLDYRNEDGVVRLDGPIHLRQGARELTCASLNIDLTPALRARRIVAGGRPELVSREAKATSVISAETATLDFSSSGQPAHLHAEGRLQGGRKLAALPGEQHFESDRLDVDFDPRTGTARHAVAEGNVAVETPQRQRTVAGPPAEGTARLTTAALLLDFGAGRGGRTHLRHAESPVPSVIEMRSPRDTSILRLRRLTAEYGPGSLLRQLHGREGVEIERHLPNQPVQTSRSDAADMDFDAGRWTEARQDGNVRFEEAAPPGRRRTGHAEHARLLESADTLTLSKNAELSDAESDSVAPTIVLNQRTGEARAEGGVRTTYRRVDPQSALNFAPQPAHIAADRLAANRASGHALYSGHARMWQGDAVIQAESIELRRDERELAGTGNVNARLPQVAPPAGAEGSPAAGSAPAAAGQTAGAAGQTAGAAAPASPAAKSAMAGEPVTWAVHAARLLYRGADAVTALDQGVRAESRLGRMSAAHMDLFLAQTNGVQQLSKSVSTGGVTVWQGARRGTADRAVYTAADGSFVLSGGNPTLFDADQGTTTGRELTFFLADDRILVGSGDGTRTVSRHRIQ